MLRSAIQQGMVQHEKVSYKFVDRAIQRCSVHSTYIFNVQATLTTAKILFQLQILPPRGSQTRYTAYESPGTVSDPENAEAFPKEAGQMLSWRTQPEAQVPDGAEYVGAGLWF